jgi:hypothetical protein
VFGRRRAERERVEVEGDDREVGEQADLAEILAQVRAAVAAVEHGQDADRLPSRTSGATTIV